MGTILATVALFGGDFPRRVSDMETKARNGRGSRWLAQTALVGIGALLGVTAAYGQGATDTGLRFNFSTPGARSLSMGGAFIGLADDATAAYTNPAGLSNLAVGGPELAIEGRSWRFYNRFTSGGNLSGGEPTGIGLDTVEGRSTATAPTDARGISFLSFGYVLPRGWTIALYRHEPVNFASRSLSQGIFLDIGKDNLDELAANNFERCDLRKDDLLCRYFATQQAQRVIIENYGISLAHEFLNPFPRQEGSLSLGLGISYYRAKIQQRTDFFGYKVSGNGEFNRLPGYLFGPTDLLDDQRLLTGLTEGTDSGLGINAGILWKLDKQGRWSLGAVFREGRRFQGTGTTELGPLGEKLAGKKEPVTQPVSFRLPDSWGLGASYAPDRQSKVTLDFDQIRYSQRLTELSNTDGIALDDSNEIHLGFERILPLVEGLFVATFRVGAWQESYHEFRGTTPDAKQFFPPGGKPIRHFSGGLGLVVKEDYQIDVAADLSSAANTVSVSFVRFF